MRDLFETDPLGDPVSAARRGVRPAVRRRFYAKATVATTSDGNVVQLDGKPVRTPASRLLAAPTHELAEAIASEWDAQREVIDPAKMPLTRLANSIIDGVERSRGPVKEDIKKYLASDLLLYRASHPEQLRQRQASHWDPILAWAGEALDARFRVAESVTHISQSEAAVAAAAAAIPDDPWRLGATHVVTTLTGSALVALAVACGRLSSDAGWQAAHVDEDWNLEQWGRDEIALERRESQFKEFQAAVLVLQMQPG